MNKKFQKVNIDVDRVTLKDEKALRTNRAYTTLDSNKAGVRFRNAAVADINADHAALTKEYEKVGSMGKEVSEEVMGKEVSAALVKKYEKLIITSLPCMGKEV